MNEEKQQINSAFSKLVFRLQSFYSYEDIDQVYQSLGLDIEKIQNTSIEDLLNVRRAFYENSINSIIEDFEDKDCIKSKIEELKFRVNRFRKLNKRKLFLSSLFLHPEAKELMHFHLKAFELFLEKRLATCTEKEETVGLRGKGYPVLTIMQKAILIHYLTENALFPEEDLFQPRDKYISSLAKLLSDSGTNVKKKSDAFRNNLKEFRIKKEEEKIQLEDFSKPMVKDVKAVKIWLNDMGLKEIIQKIDNEFDIM